MSRDRSEPGPIRPEPAVLERLIRAAAIPGVGPIALKGAVENGAGSVSGLESLIRERSSRLSAAGADRVDGWVRRIMETVRRERHHVLVPGLTSYPESLMPLDEPPYPLFARGRLTLLEAPTVAIVGTRAMTAYGRESAHRLAAGLAAAGATVVSGLARGVDGVAHRGAGAGRTVGVVGCGLDVAYPRAHAELQEAIGREGLLLGELLPGTPPARHAFPKRNRIIAAVSRAVIVVEAPHGSGALSTAALAREQGKDIYAVPGPIWSRVSEGTNALIRDGAKMVTSAREVAVALGLPEPPPDAEKEIPPPGLEGQALALWRALGPEPRHADEVVARAGLEPRRGLASLLSLEIQGHARQVSGMRFRRRGTGHRPT
ncbi:MAG: DNA-processing protein DprA [Candidatus Longimicrobiales bacterium M2_2A_002]